MAEAWDVIAGALGFGGPSGNDRGSSNWAAWGHEEICSMLSTTVDPADIHDAAHAWREQGRRADDLVTGLARDLQGIVTGGWRGASAERALGALSAINQWSASQTEIAARTTELMDSSGAATAQTKTLMPAPVSHSWGESLGSFMVGGIPGAVIDAVAQERAQSEAHAQAVRVMTDVYSAPLNDYRTGIPISSQMADPTLAQPAPSPNAGPAPGAGHVPAGSGGASVAAGATDSTGAHGASLRGVAAPAPVTLQDATSSEPIPDNGAQVAATQTSRRGQHTGGQVAAELAAAAAGVPIAAPVAASAARRARPSGGGIPIGGGGPLDTHRASRSAEFGPRPAGVTEPAESRMSGGPGRCATAMAESRMGMGTMPIGAGSGQRGEDAEHHRPSYLVEMDDVFTDGRKVAPAVIGEDPPEQRI